MRALVLLAGLAAALFGCNYTTTVPRNNLNSFKVELVCAGLTAADCPTVPSGTFTCPTMLTPPNLGSPTSSVDRDQLFYMAQVSTFDSMNNPFTDYNGTANVYIQFEGSVTPLRNALTPPLATLPFQNGQACLALSMPPAFNQTNIWVEDPVTYTIEDNHRQPQGTYAMGASGPIYRPAPLIADVAFTNDAVEQTSALNNKHVIIAAGAGGAPIVVTYISTNFFTVTDLGQPGEGHPWGSVEMYTYSQPYGIAVGSVVSHLNGSIQNYLGLPEVNFPVWNIDNEFPAMGVAPIPDPHRILHSDIPNTLGAMAPYKSGIVEVRSDSIESWEVCPLRLMDLASYYKYGEWLLSTQQAGCSETYNTLDVVTTASIPNFDPIASVGMKVCRLAGILSVVVPAPHINLWTITPRTPDDLGAVVKLSDPCP